MVSNHLSSGLSTNNVIPSSPEEFPEVEELYAISPRMVAQFVMRSVIAVPTTEVPINPSNRNYNKIFSRSKDMKPKSPASILESQERFERTRKSENQARKEVAKERKKNPGQAFGGAKRKRTAVVR